MRRSWTRTGWWAATAAAAALLVAQAAAARDQPLDTMHSTWRYWDDVALATTRYLEWTHGSRGRSWVSLQEAAPPLQHAVERQTVRLGIRPWEFWRTIPERTVRRWPHRARPAPLEDVGRSMVLAVGFLAVAGVAPYLLVWLGLLLALPVLLWMAAELRAAGWPLAGPAVVFLCAASPFVAEVLTLPHSAVAFYLVALFALVAVLAWATSDVERSPRGLWLRVGVVAAIFALCTIARAGTLLLLPGFVLALHWAGRRHFPAAAPGRLRQAGRTAVLVGAFLLPYVLFRPPHYHNVWLGLWEGLGDFGRDRGYSWYDADARRFLVRAGMTPFGDPKEVSAEHERFFRQTVIRDLTSDPLWYAGILARRAAATVGMTHLLPWFPRDGDALGVPRFHYKYATPADWFGPSGKSVEVPVEAMWLVPLGVVALWLAARRRPTEERRRPDQALRMTAAVVAACLPLPVLVSTASGLETQATLIAYFLSAGLLLDEARAGLSRPSR